jgi:endonuclease III
MTRMTLVEAVSALVAHYGELPRLEADPWKAILWENVAYLVDDDRRRATYDALEREIGLTPEAILGVPTKRLAKVIAGGGMKPEMRADKVHRAAAIAQEVDVASLHSRMRADPSAARRVLKRFPGIADPGADRLLMAAGAARTLAPESNGLRVLLRLGWGTADEDYGRAYRSVTAATAPSLPDDPEWLARAHVALRHHGKTLCLRGEPRCSECPLRARCPSSRGA